MDDKMFEQRLQQLKSSYDEIPARTTSHAILQKINEVEVTKKKRLPFHLPYVASFIGVLLIAGLLAAQLVGQNNKEIGSQHNAESAIVSQDLIDQKAKELENHYNQMVEKLTTELEIESVENYRPAAEAKILLENFKTASSKIYASKENLEIHFEDTKKKIERLLMTPEAEMKFLSKQKEVTDPEVIALLEKQELLVRLFNERWDNYYGKHSEKFSNKSGDLTSIIMSHKDFRGTDIREFTKQAIESGYVLIQLDEQPELLVGYGPGYGSYGGVANIPGLSERMKKFLVFKSSNIGIVNDGELQYTWNDLADQIIGIETFIQKNPKFVRNGDLFYIYERYFKYYVHNTLDSSSIYENEFLKEDVQASYERIINLYRDTETGKAIESFYKLLKENGFKAIDTRPEIPQLVYVEKLENEEELPVRIEGESLSLTPELQSIYKEYKAKQNDMILRGLRPFDVMRLYMHASDLGDWNTAYALYYKSENTGVPEKEMYINERLNNKTSFLAMNDKFQYAEEHPTEDGIMFLYLYTDEYTPGNFRLYNDNGIWKVGYMPMQ